MSRSKRVFTRNQVDKKLLNPYVMTARTEKCKKRKNILKNIAEILALLPKANFRK